jgi:ABC-2 type transport system permease protein
MNAPAHSTHKFPLLLRREYWEHKGGFLWAPLIAGGVFLLLSLMGFGLGEMAARRSTNSFDLGDSQVQFNGIDFSAIAAKMDAGDMDKLGKGIDAALMMAASWPFIVLAFVVFFYCLGALYDERKDRSVLFWKSLPLSDSQTVLSKVATAAVVAPLLAIAAALVTMFGFLVVIGLFVMVHGGNPMTMVFGPASPLAVAGQLVAMLPIYALWAMPTLGWLLLCSSWARNKPFLWAIMIPLFAGIFVSWFDLMQLFDLPSAWFWQNIVGRSLLSAVPGSWLTLVDLQQSGFQGADSLGSLVALRTSYATLLTPQLWIGVVAGAAMIFGAIRMRRWRDEG